MFSINGFWVFSFLFIIAYVNWLVVVGIVLYFFFYSCIIAAFFTEMVPFTRPAFDITLAQLHAHQNSIPTNIVSARSSTSSFLLFTVIQRVELVV